MQKVDIIIIGGGMIGLALACGLEGSGMHVAVLEQHAPKMLAVDTPPSLRVSTINVVSEKLLIDLGVWFDIIKFRASCCHSIEVWDKDSFGHITFDNIVFGYNHVGYIIENEIISAALWQRVQNCPNVILITPAYLQQVTWSENEAFITFKNGDMLAAKLIVGADGANSWLRDKGKIPIFFWNYRHHALVANIRTTESHGSVARQIFHSDGILAFLPLSDQNLCSIVWSLTPDKAQQMCEADIKTFNQALCVTFDNRLGLCSLDSERQTFPLIGRYARQFAAHRLVLIGDAAHTIHPLVGQGVNMGFMDVIELIKELRSLYSKGKDIGQYFYLRRYERSRKHSSAMMLLGVHCIYEFFSGNFHVKKLVRNLGMKFVDTFPSIKLQLMRQAMGLNDLPHWFY